MKTTGDTRFVETCAGVTPGFCRFWLVDDDAKYRQLQCELLQSDDRLVCVGSYASADAALAALASVTPPDLILMDVNMPGTGGIEAIPLVRAMAPGVRILMNTTFIDLLDEQAALAAGASSYLTKWRSLAELLSAIWGAMSRPVPVPMIAPPTASARTPPWRSWLQALQNSLASIVSL